MASDPKDDGSDVSDDKPIDKPLDRLSDEAGPLVWLTFSEIGKKLGINTASARRRAYRSHWARRMGNDGLARVGVPSHVFEDVANDVVKDMAGDKVRDVGKDSEIARLQAVVARQEGETDGLRAVVARFEADATQIRSVMDELNRRVAAAETAKAVAEAKLQALEAEVSRRRGSWLGRLLGW